MKNKLKELKDKYAGGFIKKNEYITGMHKLHSILWDYQEYIKNSNVRSIEISHKYVLITTTNNITMICDKDDERIIPIEIINFGNHEQEELKMISRFVKNDYKILDIGANIGWYSINLARMVPKGLVFAFEPIPKTFNYLKNNIMLNGIKNVKIYKMGFSDKRDVLQFYFDPKLGGATSLRNLHEDRIKIKVKCNVFRLDEYYPKLKSRIDFIKCDVEGAELLVVKGGINTIIRNKPIIFLEMLRKWSAKFNYHPDEIINLLKKFGYLCFFAKNSRLRIIDGIDESTEETNFYFLDSKKHSKLIKELC